MLAIPIIGFIVFFNSYKTLHESIGILLFSFGLFLGLFSIVVKVPGTKTEIDFVEHFYYSETSFTTYYIFSNGAVEQVKNAKPIDDMLLKTNVEYNIWGMSIGSKKLVNKKEIDFETLKNKGNTNVEAKNNR